MRKIFTAALALALGAVLALGAGSSAFAMSMYVDIAGADTLTLVVEPSDSVQQVKHKISDATGFPVDDQVLLFAGKVLADGRTLADYNVQEGSTLVLVVAPHWVDDELATPILNEAYSDVVSASGGDVSYAIAAGELPVGLTLDTGTGEVSGMATASGAYAFTVTAGNLAGTIEHGFTGEVAAVSPTPTPEPTPEPTPTPSPEPSPTPEPTPSPTPEPSPTPKPSPTSVPAPDGAAAGHVPSTPDDELAQTGPPSPGLLVLVATFATLLGSALWITSRSASRSTRG